MVHLPQTWELSDPSHLTDDHPDHWSPCRLTLLALDAVQHPEHSPRMRALLVELDDAVVRCEADQEIYVPLCLEP
jgi:hypothetical protein